MEHVDSKRVAPKCSRFFSEHNETVLALSKPVFPAPLTKSDFQRSLSMEAVLRTARAAL
jgi:hypothetical protein